MNTCRWPKRGQFGPIWIFCTFLFIKNIYVKIIFKEFYYKGFFNDFVFLENFEQLIFFSFVCKNCERSHMDPILGNKEINKKNLSITYHIWRGENWHSTKYNLLDGTVDTIFHVSDCRPLHHFVTSC